MMANPQSYPIKNAAYWASEMARLRAIKPPSLSKYCGKNKESGCVADWERRMKTWNKAYRAASKKQKISLEKDNAEFYKTKRGKAITRNPDTSSSRTIRKYFGVAAKTFDHKPGYYVEYKGTSGRWETYGLFPKLDSARKVCVLLAEQNPKFAVRVISQ
jgi:hypothetical protein